MKNYYEILEVNPKASKEVIEKAYRVLAKKYHPDLYTGEKKQYAERKIKELNAAYNILSDEFLREQYDYEIKRQEIEDIQDPYRETKKQSKPKKYNQETRQGSEQSSKQQRVKNQKVGTFGSIFQLTKELIQNLVRNKEQRKQIKEITKIDILAIILTIIVIILLGVILWFIPFTNGWMRQLLFENALFSWIGGLFAK